jgi:hypothetical protein
MRNLGVEISPFWSGIFGPFSGPGPGWTPLLLAERIEFVDTIFHKDYSRGMVSKYYYPVFFFLIRMGRSSNTD